MTLPKFVSVMFYPAYSTNAVSGCGRYVALGEDGRVYVWVMSGTEKWQLIGPNCYNELDPQP